MSEYGATYKTAEKKYWEFVEAGIENPLEYPADKIIGQAVLGNETFVQKVVSNLKRRENLGDISGKRYFSGRPGVNKIYCAVCDYYGIDELNDSRAQDMFVCIAKEKSHSNNREIAEKMGGKGASAIAHHYRRVMKKIEGNRKSIRQFEKEKNDILSLFEG